MKKIERNLRSKIDGLNMEYEKGPKNVEAFKVLELETVMPKNNRSCFYIRGARLRQVLRQMVDELCERKKINRHKLCKEITHELKCDETTIEKFIYKKDYFPIYLTRILLEKLPKYRRHSYSEKIQKETELFKFGTSEKWAKFPKKLNGKIAWLCGAIAADGWLAKEKGGKERLGIIDQNICELKLARKKFEETFGIKVPINKSKTLDCYLLIVDCKAVSKFFTTFLGFKYGRKIETISEPTIIKKSSHRLEFAKGVLSFDGSVELDCTVSIGLKNKKLVQDIYGILRENEFDFKYSRPNSDFFFIRSPGLSECKNNKAWISLFGINSTKGDRLNFLINGSGKKVRSEEEAIRDLEKFVRRKPTSKVSIVDIFNFAKENKKFTKHQMMKRFNIAYATFWKYALILRRANILSSEEKTGRGIQNNYVFNPNIEEWRIPTMAS